MSDSPALPKESLAGQHDSKRIPAGAVGGLLEPQLVNRCPVAEKFYCRVAEVRSCHSCISTFIEVAVSVCSFLGVSQVRRVVPANLAASRLPV